MTVSLRYFAVCKQKHKSTPLRQTCVGLKPACLLTAKHNNLLSSWLMCRGWILELIIEKTLCTCGILMCLSLGVWTFAPNSKWILEFWLRSQPSVHHWPLPRECYHFSAWMPRSFQAYLLCWRRWCTHSFHVSARGSPTEQTAVSLFLSPSVVIYDSDRGWRCFTALYDNPCINNSVEKWIQFYMFLPSLEISHSSCGAIGEKVSKCHESFYRRPLFWLIRWP